MLLSQYFSPDLLGQNLGTSKNLNLIKLPNFQTYLNFEGSSLLTINSYIVLRGVHQDKRRIIRRDLLRREEEEEISRTRSSGEVELVGGSRWEGIIIKK